MPVDEPVTRMALPESPRMMGLRVFHIDSVVLLVMLGLDPSISGEGFSGLRGVYPWADRRSDPRATPENDARWVPHLWRNAAGAGRVALSALGCVPCPFICSNSASAPNRSAISRNGSRSG